MTLAQKCPPKKTKKAVKPGRKMTKEEAREMIFREYRQTFELLAKHTPNP